MVDPVLLQQQLGSAHVKGTYHFGSQDYLNEGSDRIIETGMRVFKGYLFRPAEFYPHGGSWPAFDSMVEIAQHSRFVTLFQKPFHTYVLTAYSFVDDEHYFRNGVSSTKAQQEEQAFYNLASHLLTTYNGTGKTFVLSHWEGDWAIRGSYCTEPECDPGPTAIQGMIDWLNARQDGVIRARQDHPGSDVEVYHAAEVNLVQLAMQGRTTVTNDVLPHTYCDLYSYSAWDSIGQASADPGLTWSRQAFRSALDYLASKAPDSATFGNRNVYSGEYGWPSVNSVTDPGATDAKQMLVLRMATEEAHFWGCPYILYWQVFDNEARVTPPGNEDVRGLYLIRPDGTEAPPWKYFNAILPQQLFSTSVLNPSFEDRNGSYEQWEVVHTNAEGPDFPLLSSVNPYGITAPQGQYFAGKITSFLRPDFYVGQIVQTTDYLAGYPVANWSLDVDVQLHGLDGSTPVPEGVHQVWEVGWNADGSQPEGIMNCDHYQLIGALDGSHTGNSATAFAPYVASGHILGTPGVEAVAIRLHLYADSNWSWTHLNFDDVNFSVSHTLTGLGTVMGVVRDQYDSPVTDATVTVTGAAPVQTDGNGAYQLQLPSGEYDLVANKAYYDDFTSDPFSISSGEITNVDVSLQGQSPDPVISFGATSGNGEIVLDWIAPAEPPLSGVRILYRTDRSPTGPSDGTILADRAASPSVPDGITHDGLSNGQIVYYAAFAYSEDASRYYADGLVADDVPTVPSDLDFDGDVDLDDFALFQRCRSSEGTPPPLPACDRARFDYDVDVDDDDQAVLLGCLSGAGMIAAPDCATEE